MPAVPDRRDVPGPATMAAAEPGRAGEVVGFLDAPDLALADLAAAIVDAFSRLAGDAVLTVYSTGIAAHDLVDRCAPDGIALVHALPQPAGTTFVLQRAR